MHRPQERDPVALFEFALGERDWLLANLIAQALDDTGAGSRGPLELAAEQIGGTGTLQEVAGMARIARMLGIDR